MKNTNERNSLTAGAFECVSQCLCVSVFVGVFLSVCVSVITLSSVRVSNNLYSIIEYGNVIGTATSTNVSQFGLTAKVSSSSSS